MKSRRLAFCLLLLGLCSPLAAQEPLDAEVDFVRKLRSKQYPEFAREYAERVLARAAPQDSKLTAQLLLEYARATISVSADKSPDQRIALFRAAQQALQKFLTLNEAPLESAYASLELARLHSAEGQTHLTIAMREPTDAAAHEKAAPALAAYQQAAQEFEQAAKRLQAAADGLDSKAPKSQKIQLEQEAAAARLQLGVSYLDQARAVIDLKETASLSQRAAVVKKAKEIFVKLADDETTSTGVLAAAWMMKVAIESDEPAEVRKYYLRVNGVSGPQASAGKRLAELLDMKFLMADPTNKLKGIEKLAMIDKKGRAWVSTYKDYLNTPEGQGILYELGQANYQLSKASENLKDPKDAKAAAAVEAHLAAAQKFMGQLAEMEGEYAEKAKQFSIALNIQSIERKGEAHTFDDLYLRGKLEREKYARLTRSMQEADPAKAKALDAERQKHLREAIRTGRRALALATSKTPLAKVDEVKLDIAGAYVADGDLPRAAIMGEALAHSRPATKHSAEGAIIAIECYAGLIRRETADSLRQAMRQRLFELCAYVLSPGQQKLWAGEQVSNLARWQVAMLHDRDGNFKEAVSYLEKLTPDYPGYLYGQGQAVFISLKGREKAQSDDEKKAYLASAKAAVARLKDLPASADATTALMYFTAKQEKSKFLYSEASEALNAKNLDLAAAKYGEMGASVQELRAALAKYPGKLAKRTDLEFSLGVLQKYADLGQADVDLRRNNFDAVLKRTEPTVSAVLATAKKLPADAPIKMADYSVTGEVVGQALRARVQKGEMTEAKVLLDVMKRLRSDEGGALAAISENVVRQLLQEIAGQIQEMKRSGQKEKLKLAVSNYASFIEEISKGISKSDLGGNLMLGRAYESLDLHAKASEIFARFPAPAWLEKYSEKKKLTPEEEKEANTYWYVQVDLARALRRTKTDQGLKEADKVVNLALSHPTSKIQLYAEIEKCLILEDQGHYGVAAKRWSTWMRGLSGQIGSNEELKKLYFSNAVNFTRSLAKYAQLDPKVTERKKFVALAADQILKLEFSSNPEGWAIARPQYEELLRENGELRAEYERQKAERKKG